MRILDNYIARAVITSTIATFVILLALVAFFELLNELDDVGEGDYRIKHVFLYVLLILPRMAYEVFPIVVLLGSLIGLGSLANQSELIAMRAAGVSLKRIIWSVMRVGVMAIVVVVFFGEVVAPNTEQYAERMRMEKVSKQITLKSKHGFWARDDNAFINIRQILPGNLLRDVYIYEFDEKKKLIASTHAQTAQYQGDSWQLKGISQSHIGDRQISSTQVDEATWNSMLNPKVLDVVVVKPSMLPIWDLYQYIAFMSANGQEVAPYQVAFWGKLVMPVVTLIMIFLSVPFVFGILRSVGIGQRVFFGTLVGLGFFLLNRIFGHMAVVYELNPLIAASLPALLFFAVGLWFTRRII
ncbi:MAG: LPS export ABC transporter permease LptG [Chromatiales bacterium]|nr:LPS export ABC transporter permease LptG [Chromatiales bacterium]